MFERIVDLECNRCKGTYQSHERDTLQVLYNHCYFSICPKCTEEVAALMGFTKAELLKQYSGMREAETENNRLRRIKEGVVCKKCETKFIQEEPRVKKDDCSNTYAWHIKCYDA